ncbi:MAG: hypothetical protein AB7S38_07700 [Vulcanimicrobiota bacterium]
MKRGHSLAEVVISIFLLGLVVGAILNLWPTSLLSVERNEARMQAMHLAQNGLETVAREPFQKLLVRPVQVETIGRDGRDFVRRLTVTGLGPSLCELVVEVSWEDHGRQARVEERLFVSELHR